MRNYSVRSIIRKLHMKHEDSRYISMKRCERSCFKLLNETDS